MYECMNGGAPGDVIGAGGDVVLCYDESYEPMCSSPAAAIHAARAASTADRGGHVVVVVPGAQHHSYGAVEMPEYEEVRGATSITMVAGDELSAGTYAEGTYAEVADLDVLNRPPPHHITSNAAVAAADVTGQAAGPVYLAPVPLSIPRRGDGGYVIPDPTPKPDGTAAAVHQLGTDGDIDAVPVADGCATMPVYTLLNIPHPDQHLYGPGATRAGVPASAASLVTEYDTMAHIAQLDNT